MIFRKFFPHSGNQTTTALSFKSLLIVCVGKMLSCQTNSDVQQVHHLQYTVVSPSLKMQAAMKGAISMISEAGFRIPDSWNCTSFFTCSTNKKFGESVKTTHKFYNSIIVQWIYTIIYRHYSKLLCNFFVDLLGCGYASSLTENQSSINRLARF